jgi:hypothetical protein
VSASLASGTFEFWFHTEPIPSPGLSSWSGFQNPAKAFVVLVRPPATLKTAGTHRVRGGRVAHQATFGRRNPIATQAASSLIMKRGGCVS